MGGMSRHAQREREREREREKEREKEREAAWQMQSFSNDGGPDPPCGSFLPGDFVALSNRNAPHISLLPESFHTQQNKLAMLRQGELVATVNRARPRQREIARES